MKNNYDKFRGCMIGGVIGDALGYAIEFEDIVRIKRIYGKNGIEKYKKINGDAIISDDTQMTMFTAAGIIVGDISDKDINNCIYYSYLNWLTTQGFDNKCASISWLYHTRNMYFRRAPGNTCLSALRSGKMGTLDESLNDSKGCGGVMRVAPIGLYFSNKPDGNRNSMEYGAKSAAITHSHVMGYLPAALLSIIIYNIMNNKNSLKEIIIDSNKYLLDKYKEDYDSLYNMINTAINLSENNLDDILNIEKIGEGWCGDEAIAIAVYCALKYSNDFKKAIIAAVNHSGDSDSTGAITGNIIGCFLGYKKIPKEYIIDLELIDELEQLTKDLYDCTYKRDKFIKKNNVDKKYVNL